MKKNYKFIIAYDGSRYYGWEHQPDKPMTIQGKLENVLTQMSGEPVEVSGAGRTDAGVHARAMVANARFATELGEDEIRDYMNRYLPEDICIREVRVASERFHSRYNAIGKTYRYTCYVGDVKPVFDRKYVYNLNESMPGSVASGAKKTDAAKFLDVENIRRTEGNAEKRRFVDADGGQKAAAERACAVIPDVERMRQAAQYLMGTHDFASFCSNPRMKKSTVRKVDEIVIVKKGAYLTFTYHGTGFLQHMVRIMTGTLLEVGYGKRTPESMTELLEAKKRALAGFTAPAKGLCLIKVDYD